MKKKVAGGKTRGFTLIELLVVISIIGTLSTIVMASLGGAKVKADDAKKILEVKSVDTAIKLYESNKNKVPGNFLGVDGVTRDINNPITDPAQALPAHEGTSAYDTSMQQLVDNGVIKAIPKSSDGQSYSYFDYGGSNGALFSASLSNGNSSFSSNWSGIMMTPGHDYYFSVESGTYTFDQAWSGGGFSISPNVFARKSELIEMPDNNPLSSGSDTYFVIDSDHKWYRYPSSTPTNPSTPISTKYFIIRKNSYDSAAAMTIPSNVRYYGATTINGSPRPW